MDAQLIILDEIKARLGNLSIANGYRFDIEPTSIDRARLEPFKNGDLPANPLPDFFGKYVPGEIDGLTKREHFAAMAMQGLSLSGESDRDIAVQSVNLADELLKARDSNG